jgi:hypothetical protein
MNLTPDYTHVITASKSSTFSGKFIEKEGIHITGQTEYQSRFKLLRLRFLLGGDEPSSLAEVISEGVKIIEEFLVPPIPAALTTISIKFFQFKKLFTPAQVREIIAYYVQACGRHIPNLVLATAENTPDSITLTIPHYDSTQQLDWRPSEAIPEDFHS